MVWIVSVAAAEGMKHARRILVGEQAEDQMKGAAGRDRAAEMVGDGAGRGGIVGAVEPELRLPRQQVADRTGRKQLQPGRPFRPAHGGAERGLRNGEAALMAKHRHGEPGICRLMRAGQARQGQVETALHVAIMEPAVPDLRMPGPAARQPKRADNRRPGRGSLPPALRDRTA